jgi:hypothetical protein
MSLCGSITGFKGFRHEDRIGWGRTRFGAVPNHREL